jgi:spore maturation protein CgeB
LRTKIKTVIIVTMKIIFACPRDLTAVGIIGTYCRKALASLGHEVRGVDFRRRPFDTGIAASAKVALRKILPHVPSPFDVPLIKHGLDKTVNSQILHEAAEFKPDVFLALLGENIVPDTLSKLRADGIITVNWVLDTLLSESRRALVREFAPHYDFLFLIDSPELLARFPVTARHIETLCLGFDPDVHHPRRENSSAYISDLSFVGSLYKEREDFLAQLAGFGLKIWGRWEQEDERLKGCYCGKDVYGQEAAALFRGSKIVVDYHALFGKYYPLYNVSPRLFEVPACGGFLLTNESSQIAALYRVGEEIAVYKNIDELKTLITYYLSHEEERLRMAEKARLRAQEYTYVNRFKRMFEIIATT